MRRRCAVQCWTLSILTTDWYGKKSVAPTGDLNSVLSIVRCSFNQHNVSLKFSGWWLGPNVGIRLLFLYPFGITFECPFRTYTYRPFIPNHFLNHLSVIQWYHLTESFFLWQDPSYWQNCCDVSWWTIPCFFFYTLNPLRFKVEVAREKIKGIIGRKQGDLHYKVSVEFQTVYYPVN